MMRFNYLLIVICMIAGLSIAATKTVTKTTATDERKLEGTNFRSSTLLRLNQVADDIDTTLAHVTTLETATAGVSADTIYKTAVKGARVRGDSVIGIGSQFTRLRGDSAITTTIKSTRVRSDSSIITATQITRARADSSIITAATSTRSRTDSLIATSTQITRARADSAIITAVKSDRSRPSHLIADSITVSSGGNIKALTVKDGTNDTLIITIGAKTWKFLPVADQ